MHHDLLRRFERYGDAHTLAAAVALAILETARAAVAERGRFRIVLAGGTTPLAAYRLLVHESAHWEAWEVYFGDERCLPPNDPERNSRGARQALLDQVPIPGDHVFPIPAELGAEQAAEVYERTISARRPFDLVLLGMGEDGHTASLFPGHAIPHGALVMPVHGAPKPPSDRVSLTPQALADCRSMLVVVAGVGKRSALMAWRDGADLPVARVADAGRARILVDANAADDAIQPSNG